MPTPKRPPAFQFYPDAWFGSIAVELMPPEVEGTYIRLLARQWLAVALPADPAALRLLTKLTPPQWKKAWALLEPQFPLTPDGAGRQNPTLHAVHEERQDFIAKQAENGKKGGRPTGSQKEPKITQAFSLGSVWVNPNESSVSGSGSGSGSGSLPLSQQAEDGVIPSAAPAEVKQWVASFAHEPLDRLFQHVPDAVSWVGVFRGYAAGLLSGRPTSAGRLGVAVQEFVARGKHLEPDGPSLRLFKGFVQNAQEPANAPKRGPTDAEWKAEQLRDLRDANDTRRRLGLEDKPLPPWASEIDAMFPDGRTFPVSVAA